MAKVESAIRAVLDFEKALNPFNRTLLATLLSEDCIFEDSTPVPSGKKYTGKAAVLAFLERQAQTHGNRKVENITGLGDRCLVFWIANKRGIDIYRVANHQVLERLSYVKDNDSSSL